MRRLFFLLPLLSLAALVCFLVVALSTPGSMEVTSDPPGATVFLDQNKVGQTLLVLQNVDRGEHGLRLALKGYHDEAFPVRIWFGKAKVHVPLKPVPPAGSLNVSSDPSGAVIWLNGSKGPKTPAHFSISPGTYLVKIERNGWVAHEQTVEITVDLETSMKVQLSFNRMERILKEIDRQPEALQPYLKLLRLYFNQGEVEKGFQTFQRFIKVYAHQKARNGGGFQETLKELQVEFPDYESEHWKNLAEGVAGFVCKNPKTVQGYRLASELLVGAGRWKELQEISNAVIEAGDAPTSANFYRMVAVSQLGDVSKAEKDLAILAEQNASLLEAESSPNHLLLRRWNEEDRWDFILRHCDVLAKKNNTPQLHLWRIQAAAALKKWDKVLTCFSALNQTDFLSQLGPKSEPPLSAVLWTIAEAMYHKNDRSGLDEFIKRYESDTLTHFWIPLLHGEQWLKDRKGDPPKPWLDARRCQEPPEIDGKLDEDIWKQAKESSRFFDYESSHPNALQTTIRALYDGGSLYFGIETGPEASREESSPNTNAAAFNAGIELFVDTDRDCRVYRQFILQTDGMSKTIDCVIPRFIRYERYDHSWQPPFPFAVSRTERGYQFEIGLPYNLFETKAPGKNAVWHFNLVRTDPQEGGTHASFVPIQGDFHRPGHFAFLMFR